MSRYIDAELVKESLMGWDTDPTDEEIEYAIDHIPTADVVEVKHGEWVDGYCSECGAEAISSSYEEEVWDYDWEEKLIQLPPIIHIEYHTTDYCPYCGAKMDGKENR